MEPSAPSLRQAVPCCTHGRHRLYRATFAATIAATRLSLARSAAPLDGAVGGMRKRRIGDLARPLNLAAEGAGAVIHSAGLDPPCRACRRRIAAPPN
jgi:hypothetical protein